MRRLVLFLAVVVGLLGAAMAFNWWVDPFGDIYKPGALTAALDEHPNCLVSQELVGARYFSFKLDVFHRRPTTRFVVGSSRVLKIQSKPGESSFANLGFPGTAPETILSLFRALPAKPVQTVYIGVDAFWFNSHYAVPVYRPSTYDIARYLTSRATFQFAVRYVRQGHFILTHRWRRDEVGNTCVIGRIYPSIAWKVDGSRVWSWELDPKTFPPFTAPSYSTDLATYRNGYYNDWTSFDTGRVRVLEQALRLARQRGWKVVGFAPPEPPGYFRLLRAEPQLTARWREFQQVVPALFAREGFAWAGLANGTADGCTTADFPDGFHSDAACSAHVRARLDAVASRHR